MWRGKCLFGRWLGTVGLILDDAAFFLDNLAKIASKEIQTHILRVEDESHHNLKV